MNVIRLLDENTCQGTLLLNGQISRMSECLYIYVDKKKELKLQTIWNLPQLDDD